MLRCTESNVANISLYNHIATGCTQAGSLQGPALVAMDGGSCQDQMPIPSVRGSWRFSMARKPSGATGLVTEAYLDTLSLEGADILYEIESHPNPITQAELAASQKALSRQVHIAQTRLVKGNALLMLKKYGRRRGSDCWRMKAARKVRESCLRQRRFRGSVPPSTLRQ